MVGRGLLVWEDGREVREVREEGTVMTAGPLRGFAAMGQQPWDRKPGHK